MVLSAGAGAGAGAGAVSAGAGAGVGAGAIAGAIAGGGASFLLQADRATASSDATSRELRMISSFSEVQWHMAGMPSGF